MSVMDSCYSNPPFGTFIGYLKTYLEGIWVCRRSQTQIQTEGGAGAAQSWSHGRLVASSFPRTDLPVFSLSHHFYVSWRYQRGRLHAKAHNTPPPQCGSFTCLLAPCTTLAPCVVLPRTTQFKLGSHWAAVMYETAFRSDCRIDWSPSQLCTQSFSLSNLLTLGCPQAVCVGHPLVSPLRFTHQIGTAITSPVIICHKNTVNGDQHGGAIKSSRVWDGVSTSSIRHSGETWGLSAG